MRKYVVSGTLTADEASSRWTNTALIPADGRARPLELVSVTPASTGVLICAYRPAPA